MESLLLNIDLIYCANTETNIFTNLLTREILCDVIVVALYEGLNNLKELVVDNGIYILRSCNEDKETYPDILVKNLQVQGVAVCVMHSFIKK